MQSFIDKKTLLIGRKSDKTQVKNDKNVFNPASGIETLKEHCWIFQKVESFWRWNTPKIVSTVGVDKKITRY